MVEPRMWSSGRNDATIKCLFRTYKANNSQYVWIQQSPLDIVIIEPTIEKSASTTSSSKLTWSGVKLVVWNYSGMPQIHASQNVRTLKVILEDWRNSRLDYSSPVYLECVSDTHVYRFLFLAKVDEHLVAAHTASHANSLLCCPHYPR